MLVVTSLSYTLMWVYTIVEADGLLPWCAMATEKMERGLNVRIQDVMTEKKNSIMNNIMTLKAKEAYLQRH